MRATHDGGPWLAWSRRLCFLLEIGSLAVEGRSQHMAIRTYSALGLYGDGGKDCSGDIQHVAYSRNEAEELLAIIQKYLKETK